MAKIKIAINGFGRIGRVFFRQAFSNDQVEVVAINDLGDTENLAYLLRYDSVYGRFDKDVSVKDGHMKVGDKEIRMLQEKDPGNLPWKELDIDVVIESTGVFTSREKAAPHLDAGAKRVIISAPAKDEITPTSTPNVGIDHLKLDKITSNASCTTNATTPIASIMGANPGVKKALLNTVHGYTATQAIVDGPVKGHDFRKGRAAAVNIIPSSTGAALATEKAIPSMKGKFDGIAMRVPVPAGSIIDFTFIAERSTSVEEINNIFREAVKKEEWSGVLSVTEEQLVSSDILGMPFGSIVDLSMTRVVDGDLVKVLSWYDNEWGYASMLLKHVVAVSQLL
ncbi:MAG: type I glyceraldehyde-3-phosphate dehydrogenase [Candidatus Yanofskybacteria bacterium CG10_big_fil_rev_8_21_14_0_10_36_16]|uniref:Type I glyceraldehyde-3-phosphate dehydrogenase n=1 Tax=Candidatus Yanofskybacteria bacterium CG10_big_fil_rev_8_21_14_0_10_36_16 TaxID=1975096 RepID=A0A2J0Q7H4_9BACT|nr:MAG: type I glyceraldehyde-3-phosphate dehydrogenase [Candidatus Yanofskybacteria bacterium CG10_big_fil_rev_8_21_14_0_10_36_16]